MTFLMPHTSHEASQLARIVNKVSELSIALTHFAPNTTRLTSWPSLVTERETRNAESVTVESRRCWKSGFVIVGSVTWKVLCHGTEIIPYFYLD